MDDYDVNMTATEWRRETWDHQDRDEQEDDDGTGAESEAE